MMKNQSPEKIKVQYFGSVRAVTKKSEEEVEISSDTAVCGLLQKLAFKYGEMFEGEVFQKDQDDLRSDLVISINGTLTEHAKVVKKKINDGDIISLFPIFPGGG
jgi:MoaD family protein